MWRERGLDSQHSLHRQLHTLHLFLNVKMGGRSKKAISKHVLDISDELKCLVYLDQWWWWKDFLICFGVFLFLLVFYLLQDHGPHRHIATLEPLRSRKNLGGYFTGVKQEPTQDVGTAVALFFGRCGQCWEERIGREEEKSPWFVSGWVEFKLGNDIWAKSRGLGIFKARTCFV